MILNTISWLNLSFGLGILASAIVLSETSKSLPDSIQGGKRWARGNILFFTGLLLLGLRSQLPELIPVIFGNSLIIAALMLHYRALASVLDRKPDLKFNYAVIAFVFVGLGFFLLIHDLYAARIVVFSSGIIAFGVQFIRLLIPITREDFATARRIMFFFYGIFIVLFSYRIVFAIINILENAPFFEENLYYLTSLVLSSIMVILLTFTFVLLSNSKNFSELHKLAYLDDLTQTRSRRAILDHGVESISEANRLKIPFSIMLIDLDNLKQINDTYGHQAGDQTLIKIAAIIKENLREEDAVGRFGGDEFLVVQRHTNTKGARHTAERLMSLIDISNQQVDPGNQIHASIGISEYFFGSSSLDELIASADKALYQAKASGGGTFRVWPEPQSTLPVA